MRKVLLSIMIAFVATAMASAAPLCTGPTDVLAPGFTCEIGGLVFSNFSALPASAPAFTPSMTLVTTSVVGGTVNLNFNPGLTSGQDMWFYFSVTGGLIGVDLSLSGSGSTITEVICSQPLLGNNNCPQGTELARMTNTSGGANLDTYFSSVPTIYVWKDILVSTGELSSFSQSFHTPEPMTFVLIGTGLLGLGILGRRRAQR